MPTWSNWIQLSIQCWSRNRQSESCDFNYQNRNRESHGLTILLKRHHQSFIQLIENKLRLDSNSFYLDKDWMKWFHIFILLDDWIKIHNSLKNDSGSISKHRKRSSFKTRNLSLKFLNLNE